MLYPTKEKIIEGWSLVQLRNVCSLEVYCILLQILPLLCVWDLLCRKPTEAVLERIEVKERIKDREDQVGIYIFEINSTRLCPLNQVWVSWCGML